MARAISSFPDFCSALTSPGNDTATAVRGQACLGDGRKPGHRCRHREAAGGGGRATVAVNYVANEASANALVDELRANGHEAIAFRADVSDAGQTRDLVQRVAASLGGLDVVASSAGVEHFGALDSLTQADFDRVFHTNVAGQLFVTQAAAAEMQSGGRILLMSSISARIAVYQHTLYAASKAAVSVMVLNLAPELAERGIAINAIAPGAPPRTWPPRSAPSTRRRLCATFLPMRC